MDIYKVIGFALGEETITVDEFSNMEAAIECCNFRNKFPLEGYDYYKYHVVSGQVNDTFKLDTDKYEINIKLKAVFNKDLEIVKMQQEIILIEKGGKAFLVYENEDTKEINLTVSYKVTLEECSALTDNQHLEISVDKLSTLKEIIKVTRENNQDIEDNIYEHYMNKVPEDSYWVARKENAIWIN